MSQLLLFSGQLLHLDNDEVSVGSQSTQHSRSLGTSFKQKYNDKMRGLARGDVDSVGSNDSLGLKLPSIDGTKSKLFVVRFSALYE
jgi:hypothetical protein